ncbi:ABC transporter ATP-binding protein [Methylomonas sp. ZR1]|uniref:ABC transporter ATP-binding protein n=1 Tax=Methylomonas sp. ZR1 TaxID=1797072 RepID=UPI0014931A6A|nr:ABC transporter ATP-binding protein [Methylomonas sp. ZR1]NOV31954.1 ABC transporter ATP-binding protein [Methylomonas sp. ZR1]
MLNSALSQPNPAINTALADSASSPRSGRGRIALRDVSMVFRGSEREHTALDRVDLDLHAGAFTALLGPSGCGKSTLLNIVSGMLKPTTGTVSIDGVPVKEPTPLCNVVFQQHSLFPWLTALQNVAFGPRMLGLPDPENIALELLRMVGLERFAKAYPKALSGGMQQRVAIARALATKPTLLLMDEPFGALDAQTRSVMQEELLKIWDRFGTSVVFITHDVDEAIYLADRVIVMRTEPGGVKADIAIDLPRPRSPETLSSPGFERLRKTIHRAVREESLKVFNR